LSGWELFWQLFIGQVNLIVCIYFQVDAKHDLLVWVEILELASSGEYLPVMVERNPDLPCRSEFILRQGLQRRIRITLVHEVTEELNWNDVRELVVGRIRTGAECDNGDESYENDMSVVSLGLFPGEVLEFPGDTRHFYRFEAAWDSSLHNSVLLNRVTPSGEHIYLTMSAYVQLDNCEQLSVITKDLCVTILGRDARTGTRSLKVFLFKKKKVQIIFSKCKPRNFSNSSGGRDMPNRLGCRASTKF
jgi:kinesin family protein 1